MMVADPMAAKAAIKALLAICDAIAEAVNKLPEGMPSGHLYAMMCDKVTLQQYQQIIGLLVDAKKIKKRGDLLLPA